MVKGNITSRRRKTNHSLVCTVTASEETQPNEAQHNTTREVQFARSYGSQALTAKIPNLTKCLKGASVSVKDRAMAIDLMCQKLGGTATGHRSVEFFRSVTVMDLCLKYGSKDKEELDIGLAALAALFISIKYDNNVQPGKPLLAKLVEGTGVSTAQVLMAELEVLKELGFTLKYTCWFELYCDAHHRYFHDLDNDVKEIKDLGLEILALCALDPRFNDICANRLVISALRLAIQYFFNKQLKKLPKPCDRGLMSILSCRQDFLVDRIVDDIGDELYLKATVTKIKKHLKAVTASFKWCEYLLCATILDFRFV